MRRFEYLADRKMVELFGERSKLALDWEYGVSMPATSDAHATRSCRLSRNWSLGLTSFERL
jgi:hypothetical protein